MFLTIVCRKTVNSFFQAMCQNVNNNRMQCYVNALSLRAEKINKGDACHLQQINNQVLRLPVVPS